MNRRELFGTGLAVSALSALGISLATENVPGHRIRVTRLVVDARFSEALDLAQHAATRGIEVLEQDRDVLELWHDRLLPTAGTAPGAFAGVTTATGLFLLRTLAADRQMRVVFSAEHDVATAGNIAHRISGPASTLAEIIPAVESNGWSKGFAAALGNCSAASPRRTARITTPSVSTGRDEPLFSWLIAPPAMGSASV